MTDLSMLESIKAGYLSDDFCLRLAQSDMPGVLTSLGPMVAFIDVVVMAPNSFFDLDS